MMARSLRGEDIYRPILVINNDARLGESRPSTMSTPRSAQCVYGGSTENYVACDLHEEEFRITYSLDNRTPAELRRLPSPEVQEAWVYNLLSRFLDTRVADDGTSEDYTQYEVGRFLWVDYPDNLFDTNESKTLRINVAGSRYSEGAENHVRSELFTYSHAADMLRSQRDCVDRHVEAGRLVLPDGTESMQQIREALMRQAIEGVDAR